MIQKGLFWLGSILAFSCSAWAQLDLGMVFTQTVKTGQPWANINTRIDRLDMKMEINRGVVTTLATIEYTPGNGQTADWVCSSLPCDSLGGGCKPDSCQYFSRKEYALDSLETSFHFSQLDNTVLTDMYLWVGDTRVKAELQDRALASAQYEDIVKRRKDPALLETWGNGSYNLRIFPNESGKSRRIEIEFVQGLESWDGAFKTFLPVMHSLNKVYDYSVTDYNHLPNRAIGSISLSAVAMDGNVYSLNWEGLGSGQVTGTPLKLSALKVSELKQGALSATAACAGCITPWTALKSGTSHFGIKTRLTSESLEFEAEPAERDFLLDVDGHSLDVNTVARARKVALLSLKAYGVAPHAANLGLADGKGGISFVFDKSAPMDEANLRKAYEALKAWTPSADADAHATLKAYARSRGADAAPAIAFLINNDSTEYFHWPTIMTWPNPEAQTKYEAWEKAKTAKEDETLAALKAANAMLFGFWNDWRLARIASATGGFQVGSLYTYFYYGPMVRTTGDQVTDPLGAIHLPPLFGPGRPDAWNIVDLKVTATGTPVDGLVVLQAQPGYSWYGRGGGVMLDKIAAKRSSDYLPWPSSSRDTLDLRISGKYAEGGPVTFKITGFWGGLRFTQSISSLLPSVPGSGAAGAALWAYQQTEAWGRDLATDDIKAIQQLARAHHIVSRQTSLLALEPGVDPWSSLPAREGQSGADTRVASAPMADSKEAGLSANGSSVDKLSLEDVLNGTVGLVDQPLAKAGAVGGLAARQAGAVLSLVWDLGTVEGNGAFRILDLTGKLVAEIPAVRAGTGLRGEWRVQGRTGAYFVVAKAGKRTAVRKVLLRP